MPQSLNQQLSREQQIAALEKTGPKIPVGKASSAITALPT